MPKQYISPPEVGPTLGVYNKAIRAGNTVYISGIVSWDAEGTIIGPGDIETQARRVFQGIGRILREVGASASDVVETITYTTSILYRPVIAEARRQAGLDTATNTFIVVQNLVIPGLLLEIEAKVVVGTPKERINPPNVWDGTGRLSQAVRAGDTIYVSGQVAWDKDQKLVGPNDIEKQTEATYENLCRVLEAAGATASDVVKMVTYTTNPLYRTVISEARKRYDLTRSTNTLLIIPSLAAPELLLEVRAVAVVDTPKQIIDLPDLPSFGTYVRGVRTGKTVYVAGTVARAGDGSIVGIGDPGKQAVQVFENVQRILGAAGATFDDVVNSNQYYTNVLYRPPINDVRKRFGLVKSTNTSVVVPGLAAPEVLFELEAIAVVD